MKDFFENKTNRLLLGLSLFLNAALFLFFRLSIKQGGVPIVLHYNVNSGVDYFGEVKSIFILPAAGLLIFLVNGALSANFWKKNQTLSYFLSAAALMAQFFLVIAGIALYLINR
ncbi:hypothetical protein HY838_01895 [Candidatus Azambacteria bacterium]|nr:hypothetical protein [Candidatus Azambacteria bacterium]